MTEAAFPGDREPLSTPPSSYRRVLLIGGAAAAVAIGAFAMLPSGGPPPAPVRDPGGLGMPKPVEYTPPPVAKAEPPPAIVPVNLPVAGLPPKPDAAKPEPVQAPPPVAEKPPPIHVTRTAGPSRPKENPILARRLNPNLAAFGGPGVQNGGARSADTALGKALITTDTPTAVAEMIPNPEWTIAEGTMFACTMTTVIVSDVPGAGKCLLEKDVYSISDAYGNQPGNVLLPAGSEIVMEYTRQPVNGQERLFLAAKSARVGHIRVPLESPVGGPLGEPGVTGRVENKWGQRLAAAVTLALIGDIGQGVSQTEAAVGSRTAQGATRGVADIVAEGMDVRPRISTVPGQVVTIFAIRDLDFTNVLSGGLE